VTNNLKKSIEEKWILKWINKQWVFIFVNNLISYEFVLVEA